MSSSDAPPPALDLDMPAPAPPSPPPPPPPVTGLSLPKAELASDTDKPKRIAYRDLLAFFHAEPQAPEIETQRWNDLWELALVDAREQFQRMQMERKKQRKPMEGGSNAASAVSHTPTRGSAGGGAARIASLGLPEKRPRATIATDVEPNKASRLSRLQNRPKSSKLLQKLGSRGV